ncbi:MAG TPA: amidohydrolase family protein [Bryobacteraceae bacterium]|nr:amidohydrolase family protein [Bryobacteraceae bacterium]
MRFALVLLPVLLAAQPYDLVLNNAHVIDPESGLSAVRHIGIAAGRIAAISQTALTGRQTLDCRGLTAAPGFIDLHAHGQDEENQLLQLQDGVTTALELEIGTGDINAWYAAREGKRFINSGVTIGHAPLRIKILHDTGILLPTGPAKDNVATEEQITQLRSGIERGLLQGALGLGFGIQYTPGASRWEILEAFRAGSRFLAPAFIHTRTMGTPDAPAPDALTGLEEIIAASAITGAPIHMVHVTSSGLRQAPRLIQTIMEARARGLDISTECYPYTAAQTEIQSAIFDEGWQKVLGISYSDLQWVETGERLTAETFTTYRRSGGMVIMHMIPEEVVRFAVGHPDVIIASDGLIHNGKGHPRGAGTFSRTLGYWVRQRKTLTLESAIRKMTLLPAQRLEKYVPTMRNKGRIRVGADADITVFDAVHVIDRSTFQQPALPSGGIAHVIVAGTPVLLNSAIQHGNHPGQAIRASVRQ